MTCVSSNVNASSDFIQERIVIACGEFIFLSRDCSLPMTPTYREEHCSFFRDDIEDELRDTDDHTATTVYVYYGSGSRYYRNRGRGRGYRLYYGRKYGRYA